MLRIFKYVSSLDYWDIYRKWLSVNVLQVARHWKEKSLEWILYPGTIEVDEAWVLKNP